MRTIIYSPRESGSFFSWPEGSGPLPEGPWSDGPWSDGLGSLPEGFGAISATNKMASINATKTNVSIIQISLATLAYRPILGRDKLAPRSARCESRWRESVGLWIWVPIRSRVW